jgi:hypothetical protein
MNSSPPVATVKRSVDQGRARSIEWLLVVVLSAAKLWIAQARTLSALGWGAVDDHWFLSRAQSILAGEWLGPYDENTLVKGAGYPLFVAFTNIFAIPLLFAQQLLYAVACVVVYIALKPVIRTTGARVAIFAVLLFNPMCFSEDLANRTIRDAIYPSLALLIVAGVTGALLRRDERVRRLLPWLLLTGLAFALFWHTREEGIWIIPFLLCGIAILGKKRDARAMLIAGVPVAIFAFAYAAIVITNGLHYGAFTAVEFKEKSFLRAYGSLISVRQHPPLARIPVPKETRQRIYAVSPAFAELRPFLEGEIGKMWASVSPPGHPGEIGGGMFIWTFRDAVAAAGYYRRGAPAVTRYYDRVAAEIEAARASGRLDARRPRASMVPPLLWGQRTAVVQTWLRGCVDLARFKQFLIRQTYSEGSDEELALFADLTRSRLAPRDESFVHIIGSARYANGPLDLSIQQDDGRPVVGASVSAKNGRFEIWSPAHDAWFVLSADGREIDRIPLNYDGRFVSGNPRVRLSVDSISIEMERNDRSVLDEFRFRIMDAVGKTYQVAFLPFTIIALLLYLANLKWIVRWRGRWDLPILLAGLLASVMFHTLMLALIEVASFNSFLGRYESPGHALMILAVALAAHDGIIATRARWRRRLPV